MHRCSHFHYASGMSLAEQIFHRLWISVQTLTCFKTLNCLASWCVLSLAKHFRFICERFNKSDLCWLISKNSKGRFVHCKKFSMRQRFERIFFFFFFFFFFLCKFWTKLKCILTHDYKFSVLNVDVSVFIYKTISCGLLPHSSENTL